MRPAPKSVPQELPCPIRVLPIPSGSRSTEGTSHRGGPAPAAMGWSGFLRVVIPDVYWQACVQPRLALEWGSGADGGGGGCLHPGGKTQSRIWGESQCPAPGSPVVHGATSLLPPRGSPFAGPAATQLWRNGWLSVAFVFHPTSGCARTFPCILLSLARTPCLLCQTTEKRAYFSRGRLPMGWYKGTSARLFQHEILVTCGQRSGDRIEGASLLGLVSEPSAH